MKSEFEQTRLESGKKYKGTAQGNEVEIDLGKKKGSHYFTLADPVPVPVKVEVSLDKDGYAVAKEIK